MENVEMPVEASMVCMIDGKTFYIFMKKWIRDSGVSHQIANDDNNLFEATEIHKSIQESSGSMPVTEEGKLHVNIWQVDSTEQVRTLWPMKFFPKAGTNLFS